MVEREKVIKGLAHCTRPSEVGKGGNFCMDCPYTEPIGFNQFKCNGQQMKKDALALIKEQEAVKPTWGRGKPFCGACGLRIHGGKFCSECGKPIAWEGR